MEEPTTKKKKIKRPKRKPPAVPEENKEEGNKYNKIIQDLIKFMQSKESLFANPSSNEK
tara:strand:+ start:358 stop:534 length:177 start_codon:yes stop_codon:yes gene_type:complete